MTTAAPARPETEPPPAVVICVAGMHRSGISQVSQLLQRTGFYFGSSSNGSSAGAAQHHKSSNRQFSEINNAILASLKCSWDQPPRASDWQENSELDLFPGQARELITIFGRAYRPWGWSDPLNSITLPFWQSLLPELKVIICLRHPLVVARRLHAHNQMPLAFGLRLWASYNRALLAVVPPENRVVTHFNALRHDPRAELTRLLYLLGLPVDPEAVGQATAHLAARWRDNPARSRSGSPWPLPKTVLPADLLADYSRLCIEAGPVCQDSLNPPRRQQPHLLNGGAGRARVNQAQRPGSLPAQPHLQTEKFQAQQARLAHFEEMVRVRDEGIAWLRGELSRAEAENRLMAASKFWRLGLAYWGLRAHLRNWVWPLMHPLGWLGQHSGYWRLRSRVKQSLLRVAPGPFRRMIKTRRPVVTVPLAAASSFAPPATFASDYETLQLLPAMPTAQLRATLNALPAVATPGIDVVCFSIIDWSFRYQRPQQLMAQFAAHGHRVFYLSTTKFLPAGSQSPFSIRQVKENVYEVCLAAAQAPDIYRRVITGQTQDSLLDSLGALRETYQIEAAVSYVMTVSWSHVALAARDRWDWPVVYDCMDEWENFPGIGRALVDTEPRLVEACDVLVVTAQRLYEKWHTTRQSIILARNAVDFAFYAQRCQPNPRLANVAHPIVGYFGAIADWFDLDLMTHIARQRPGYNFVLLGGIFGVDVSTLQALSNVHLLGQQAYETMPEYLYHFDACLIPFKVNSITRATDPVKVYEYLSGGKPVVAVALPELEPLREVVYLARDPAEFLRQLDAAVAEADPDLPNQRKAVARQHTWDARYRQILAGLVSMVPGVSIIVVTYNNLELTQLCLASLLRDTPYLNYEVIVVDNHSTDGTPLFLRHLAERHPQIKPIFNSENRGFAGANNQALAQARGEYLVLLNNDTVVPSGWLSRLLAHLADESVGLVGPVTNFAGNEARLDVTYGTWGEMEVFARQRAAAYARQAADIHVLAMYCVALRRSVWARVGALDEQFEIGMFEDDDYAQRIRAADLRVVCALDVFVHHAGQASFKKLIASGEYDRLFDANRRRYETKWNTAWVPHRSGVLQPMDYSAPRRPGPSSAAQVEYARQLRLENQKWGQHLNVEASGEWNSWLDHPMILAHYQERGRIDGDTWEAWLARYWSGPAARSLDLGCGAAGKSLALWQAGATRLVEGLDISEDRVAAGEQRRQQMGVPGKFWIEDVNTVTLPVNNYDVIFSSHSFHHFLRLEHILAQVARALTTRGVFVLEEFVGPTQFQWTDLQMQQTKALLQSLPTALRMFRNDRVKIEEGRPTPEQVIAVSPFEAIRSADIGPLFKQYFDVVAVRDLGGTIQHLLYNGIVHNFRAGDQAAEQHISAICGVEDRLIDTGQLPSDFRLLVGRKK